MSERAAVIVGASSGVGRALAQELSRRGFRLVLSSQDFRDLEALAADFKARGRPDAHVLPTDLSQSGFDAEAYRRLCLERLGSVDAVFLVAGHGDPEDSRLAPDATAGKIICVNYSNALRLMNAFARDFQSRGSGRLVGFSSIAAAAPRKRNMVYASAKAGLETYLKALRHYFAGTGVIVQCYALGYVDTAMSYGKKLPLPPVSAESVARRVADHLDCDHGVVYYPGYWRVLTLALRLLPWTIYKRLDF